MPAIFFWAFVLLWSGSCLYALWRGGMPERLAALAFLVAFPASRAASRLTFMTGDLKPLNFLIDTLLLAFFVGLALRAYRLWPIAMAGMALLQVLGHLAKLADPTMFRLMYWMGRAIWAYPMLLLLALATIRHVNRVKRHGIEPSWRNSWKVPRTIRSGQRTR